MIRFIKILFLAAILAISLSRTDLVNPPTTIASTAYAFVIGGQFYPGARGESNNGRPKILIRFDDCVETLLKQNETDKLRYGDRVKVTVWKLRFFGYRTVYERVPGC